MSESKTDASVARTSKESNKTLKFIDRIKFFEYKEKNPQNWIKDIPNEDLIKDLIFLNYLIREDIPRKKEIDGYNVTLQAGGGFRDSFTTYNPPKYEEKINLLNQTIDTLKQIDDNQDKALLAYYAIQFIHPFTDGNGRTGRLTYNLIANESTKDFSKNDLNTLIQHKDELNDLSGRDNFQKEVVSAENFDKIIYREIFKDLFGNDFIEQYGSVSFMTGGFLETQVNIPEYLLPDLSEKEKKDFLLILNEKGGKFDAVSATFLKKIQENDNLAKYLTESPYKIDKTGAVLNEDEGKKLLIINAENLFEEKALNSQDIRQIIKTYDLVKNSFFEKMNDMFFQSNKYLTTNENGEKIPITKTLHKNPSTNE